MITAVDAHAAGEPGRVIVGGVLDVPGRTMFEKRLYLEEHADSLRKRMLREPRGYPAANCNLIVPPTHPEPRPATSSWSRSSTRRCPAATRSP
jgi:proline racemase